ncbi:MAG: Wzz/FepE/Etk N-terminal domain-containing protein [Wenyingzhuangia sp.]|jgi:uncharacterized protein involved in exopolysaccharide biosynthesis
METSNKNTSFQEEDTIDLIAILSNIWKCKKLILKTMLVFGLIGLLVALSTPNQYTASSMFTPNASGQSSTGSSGLKGLASLAGINLGGMSQAGQEVSPMLYGKIVESAIFKQKLLGTPLKNIEGVSDLRAYLNKEEDPSLLHTIKEYTLGLPGKVIGLFRGNDSISKIESLDGISTISIEDYEFFKAIDELLTLSVNQKEGFIEIIAKSKNPQLSAQVAKNAELLLQERIIAIKTKSSLELLAYLEQQYANKKEILNQSQERLSIFKDRNLNISTNSFSNQQTRLESELQTATAVFQNVVTQLEQVKLQVTKDTPVFSILKPVVVPNEKSGPKRSLTLVIWLFLGGILSVGFVLAKDPLMELLQQIKSTSN